MTQIERLAHILGFLSSDYEKIMKRGRGHYITERNAERYVDIKFMQEKLIKELQEDTPCQTSSEEASQT